MAAKRKKILIITDDAGESYEILYAKHRFDEQGWITHIGATKKKRLNGVIHDFEPGWNTYIERPGYLIKANVALKDVKASDYQAVLLIGGRAPEFLRHNSNLLDLIRNFTFQITETGLESEYHSDTTLLYFTCLKCSVFPHR